MVIPTMSPSFLGTLRSLGSRPLVWLTAFLLFLSACANSYYVRPNRPEKDDFYSPPARRFVINSFRLMVLPDANESHIRMEVRYSVGSSQDPKGKEGLAHLVEHLLFEGPINDEPNSESIGSALSKLSSDWNAYTTLDSTSYTSTFLPENFADVFALEILRMKRGCLGLSEEAFVREREVVRNEARQQSHGVGPQLRAALHEFIYAPGHPYRRSVIGSDKSIASLQLADACQFIKDHYSPQNTIIVISGPTSPGDSESLIRPWLRSFPSKSPPPATWPKEVYAKTKEQTKHLDTETSYLFAVWPYAANGDSEAQMQAQVARRLSEVLEEKTKKKSWAVSSGSAVIGGARNPTLLLLVALTDADAVSNARSLIEDVVKKVLEEKGDYISGISSRRSLLLSYEDLDSRTSMFADSLQFKNTRISLKEMVFNAQSTHDYEVAKSAERLLKKQTPRFLTILADSTQKAEKQEGSYQFSSSSPEQTRQLTPSESTLSAAEKPVEIPTHIGATQHVQRYRLPNGLRVLLWPNDEMPLVHMRLMIPQGASDTTQALAGVSELLPGDDDYDVTVFSMSTISENADAAMAIIAAQFESQKRIYDDKEFALYKKSLKNPKNQEASAFRHKLTDAIYGAGHPYTRVRVDANSVDALTMAKVKLWAQQHRTVNQATLVIAGRFDPTLMYQHALYNFRDAKKHAPASRDLQAQSATSKGAIIKGIAENRSSMKLSFTFRGRVGVGSDKPARDILSDLINNRLQALRAKRALSYGVRAFYSAERGLGTWWISGSVDAKRSAEATEALVEVITELRANPNGYLSEFIDARKIRMSHFVKETLTAAQAASRLTFLSRYNLEDDFYESYVYGLSTLKPADITALLDKEFNLHNAVVGLYGPAAAVSASEKKLRSLLKNGGRKAVSPPPSKPPVTSDPEVLPEQSASSQSD